MEIGGIRSCSSSSISSFDSCSDLLGLMDISAHSLAQTKERQQDDDTIFERFVVNEGNNGAADAKHLKMSRNGCASFMPDQNGGSGEGLIKQAGSLQRKNLEGEEAQLSHSLEQQATKLSGCSTAKPMGNITFKECAQISSFTCSPPSERDVDFCNGKEHFHSDALVLLANPATIDTIGAKNINSEEVSLDYVNQTHNHNSNFGIKVTSRPEADYDLQQLENSIKFFDLYKTNTSLPHPLRSMSSRCSSPDLKGLERINSDEVVCKNQSFARSLSSGMIKKDQKFASAPQKKLQSSSMHSWLNYEESRRVHPRFKGEKVELQYEAQKKMAAVVHYDNLGGKTEFNNSLSEKATLAQALDGKQRSGQPMINEELLGKAQQNRSWKISSPEGKSATSESNDLGPDELFRYLESLDVDEKYMDALMDIKNPLLKCESKERFLHTANHSTCRPTDSLSPSTSGLHMLSSNSILSAEDIPFVVDLVEVVGARQRRGGSSLWERMVGVKDHTVYCIKVVSGKHEWEVLRRYRDFMNFYQQLKRIFNGRSGSSLLSPSEEVESDSRNIFGNISPSIVQARTFRIEKFLQSLLQAGPPFSTATPLFWFLRPPQGAFECTGFEEHLMVHTSTGPKSVDVQLGNLDAPQLHSFPNSERSKREQMEDRCPITIGKTIKLVLVIHQNKSLRQVLYAQHHSCAGCYKHLDYENGLIQGFTQAFGRGRPRFCEYTGQLFCSSCHLNEVSVLPAYVLWHWDFTPRRVSQLAKAYLDSTYDQPLLCVSTVNPYLYQRVQCLRNVKETRTKLSRVLSCIRCPSRARILQILGSRRYLLENNDFFALRDLEDLSKGAFAVLPGLLTNVLKTLVLHVTKQCSVCQDSGEWCGAGILCEDPFRPIFPFNEEEDAVNCKMCNAPFHQKCFVKCSSCPSCPQDWVDTKHKAASGKDKK